MREGINILMSTQELSPKYEEFWIFSFAIWAQHHLVFFQYNCVTKILRPFLGMIIQFRFKFQKLVFPLFASGSNRTHDMIMMMITMMITMIMIMMIMITMMMKTIIMMMITMIEASAS